MYLLQIIPNFIRNLQIIVVTYLFSTLSIIVLLSIIGLSILAPLFNISSTIGVYPNHDAILNVLAPEPNKIIKRIFHKTARSCIRIFFILYKM